MSAADWYIFAVLAYVIHVVLVYALLRDHAAEWVMVWAGCAMLHNDTCELAQLLPGRLYPKGKKQ